MGTTCKYLSAYFCFWADMRDTSFELETDIFQSCTDAFDVTMQLYAKTFDTFK